MMNDLALEQAKLNTKTTSIGGQNQFPTTEDSKFDEMGLFPSQYQ